MHTTDDYYAATDAERRHLLQAALGPTHYGTPIPRTIEGYRVAMQKIEGRTPTHRGEPRHGRL